MLNAVKTETSARANRQGKHLIHTRKKNIRHAVVTESLARANGLGKHLTHAREKNIRHAVVTESLARANGLGKHLIHAREKKNSDRVSAPCVEHASLETPLDKNATPIDESILGTWTP